jgi:heme oxygenase (biliverdin-producing, ferredoxin)
MSTELDATQPVSALLRQATAAAHAAAEHSPGAGWLARGELDLAEYIRFNLMLWAVYGVLESALATHATDPVLAPTYRPAQLARTERLEADIAYLLETLPASDLPSPSSSSATTKEPLPLARAAPASFAAHPLYTAFLAAPPPALTAYLARLHTLAASRASAPLLLAHAYVRYLGDLSGGQVIRRRIAKAYALPTDDGADSGTAFYAFGVSGESGRDAGAGDMRRIKQAFREGMDEGAGDDAALKRRLADEANVAFALNTALFDALRAPTAHVAAASLPADAALGVPLSPTVDGAGAGMFAHIRTKVVDLLGFAPSPPEGDVKA